jgi:hypothetical protein
MSFTNGGTGVVAHLIVGAREEPFLAALCESLTGAVDGLIVNDNAPDPSPHAAALANSAFARAGTLHVDRTPWVDFSTARNRCLELHRETDAGPWVAFVDADEVHGVAFRRIVANLGRVPRGVDVVDGYTRHFFQSFDWYGALDRRMSLFRFGANVRWTGAVHEKLSGLDGKHLALPYCYAHYGNVLPVRRQAEKGRLYSSLGAPGPIATLEQLETLDAMTYFRDWPTPLRFRGDHPPAARTTVADLRVRYAEQFAQTDAFVRARLRPGDGIRDALRAANYEQRWRAHALNPAARRLLAS